MNATTDRGIEPGFATILHYAVEVPEQQRQLAESARRRVRR